VHPAAVVLLNLTRDQLDRSTEVAAVGKALRAALLEQHAALVVANCDDPVVTAAVDGLPHVVWVAGGAGWVDDSALCPRCGSPLHRDGPHWACSGCGLHRPAPQWELEESVMRGPRSRTALDLRLPGSYNRGNALTAVATAATLGVPPDRAAEALTQVRSVADRYAVVQTGRHRLTLLLAKNPAGWRETLPLTARADGVLLAVNAEEADGRDTSWLWDVPFDQLVGQPTAISGEAVADLGLRLTYADVAHSTAADPLTALEALPAGEITVVANYTAFASLTRRLPRGHRP
jgi:UDP-N-acetylmuramyl tripeptide synthase